MVTLSLMGKDDCDAVINILVDNGIEDDLTDGIIYVLKDRSDIMGVGKISNMGNYGVLKYIIVDKKFRGFNYGESILRGLLFKCRSLEISKVYYRNHDDYLLKVGFISNIESSSNNYSLVLDINDFFNNSCCGDIDEI